MINLKVPYVPELQLVSAGLRALRIGGRLVYSTCSLARVENDGVVEKLLQRLPEGSVKVLDVNSIHLDAGVTWEHQVSASMHQVLELEATKHGALCAPDKSGWGPIYVCVIEKVASTTQQLPSLRLLPVQSDDNGSESEEFECDDNATDFQAPDCL